MDNLFLVGESFDAQKSRENLAEQWEKELKKPKPNFILAVFRAQKAVLLYCTLFNSISYLVLPLGAYLIKFIIESLDDDNEQDAYFYTTLYALTALTYTFVFFTQIYATRYSALKIKSGIQLMIYEKLLKVDYIQLSETSGQLLSRIGNDILVWEYVFSFIIIPAVSLVLIELIIVVYINIGPTGFIGLGFILIEYLVINILVKVQARYKILVGRKADERIKYIFDVINNIRIIKMYGWEFSFIDKIIAVRAKELFYYILKSLIDSISRMLYSSGFGIAIFITFSVYSSMGEHLDAASTMSTAAALVIAQIYATRISGLILQLVSLILASAQRISLILQLDEKQDYRQLSSTQVPIIFKKATIAWEHAPQTSKDQNHQSIQPILATDSNQEMTPRPFEMQLNNLQIHKGELVIIIGPVGSGKTSLLLSLLGDMRLKSGSIHTPEYMGYISQDPWIISDTVRENILLGRPFNRSQYSKVIRACQFKQDIESLRFKDLTMIGENGITLSGGQKARLALCRAVYADYDTILLDDPLSAVDPDVGQKLFQNCIMGVLQGKTRVLVTHHHQYLQYADQVVMMDDGQVQFIGNYQQFVQEFGYEGEQVQMILYEDNEGDEDWEDVEDDVGVSKEELEEESIPLSLYLRYLKFGFYSYILLGAFAIFYIFSQFCYLMIFIWTSYWADQSEEEQEESYYLTVFGLIVLAVIITSYIRSLIIAVGFQNSSKKAHNIAFSQITTTKTNFFDKNPSGRIINRFTADVQMADDVIPLQGNDFLSTAAEIAGNIILIMIISPISVVAMIFILICFMIVFKFTLRIIRQFKRLDLISRSKVISNFTYCISGLNSIRAMSYEQYFIQRQFDAVDDNMTAVVHYAGVTKFLQFYCLFSAQTVTLVIIYAIIMLRDTIDVQQAALIITMVANSTPLFGSATFLWIEFQNNMSSVQRILHYVGIKPEGNFQKPDNLVITKGKIEFDNVHMRYRKKLNDILKGLTFTIEGGSKVGIVGRTGAGKSSILQVLFRMVPIHTGEIRIDNINISTIGIHVLRQQLCIIPQSPTLFNDTLRYNLDPLKQHTDKELKDVLKTVKLVGLDLKQIPKLSQGQKQLVCLARAILRKSKILLMDEATSSVDPETDAFIQEKVKELFADCTILCIAHRISTIIDSDFICVMDRGLVAEYDSPGRLLEDPNSMFSQMVSASEMKD